MATSTITNTVTDPAGNQVPSALVNFRLMANGSPTGGFRISDGSEVASSVLIRASTSGTWSYPLENNANIVPSGTYYVVEEAFDAVVGGSHEWALISSSSANPQSLRSALAASLPSYAPITTVPPSILGGSNVFSGTNQFDGVASFTNEIDLYRSPTDSMPIAVSVTTGISGDRVQVAPVNQATSTNDCSMRILPGANADINSGTIVSFGMNRVTGNNYERLIIQNNGPSWVIDTTKANAGVARNIFFNAGGDAVNAIPSANAIIIYGDGSVDLAGASYTANALNWVQTRTRIADPTNNGDSRLIIDTRTGTPTSNTADDSCIQFSRGGTSKWLVGLNAAGANNDRFDFVNVPLGANLLSLVGGGLQKIGMFNTAPSSQPSVSGSWGSTTGKSVAQALASLGLFVDNTTT